VRPFLLKWLGESSRRACSSLRAITFLVASMLGVSNTADAQL